MLKVLSPKSVRQVEQRSLHQQSISSWDLMERAAQRCCQWMSHHVLPTEKITVLCGMGNNGGDGLAIAWRLWKKGLSVRVVSLVHSDEMTPDRSANLKRIEATGVSVTTIHRGADCAQLAIGRGIVVDCLFGLGLDRPVTGYWGAVIDRVNAEAERVIAIDMPSGLLADRLTPPGAKVIRADYILTFQCPKLAFFLPGNARYVNRWYVVDIGLDEAALREVTTKVYCITRSALSSLYRPREKFSHKGTYGHALLIGGQYGKMGAILLSVLACMRTGSGLTSAYVPKVGYQILQTRAPEALCITGEGDHQVVDLSFSLKPNAVGVGPGLGTHREAKAVLLKLFQEVDCPLVIDADAINVLAQHPDLLQRLPEKAILTPHKLEFQRLVGTWSDDFEKLERLRAFARAQGCVLVYKGAHTVVVSPEGDLFFNTTANPGMAKGGSGDVLTGMLCSLLAQGYPPLQAALMGVYLHGLAADLALRDQSQESMLPTDILSHIGEAFESLASYQAGIRSHR